MGCSIDQDVKLSLVQPLTILKIWTDLNQTKTIFGQMTLQYVLLEGLLVLYGLKWIVAINRLWKTKCNVHWGWLSPENSQIYTRALLIQGHIFFVLRLYIFLLCCYAVLFGLIAITFSFTSSSFLFVSVTATLHWKKNSCQQETGYAINVG